MGVIIKYQLIFPRISNLKISNDLLAGDFIVDADIKIAMNRAAAGCSFEIRLYDLPMNKARQIKSKINTQDGKVTIKLGYFDNPFDEIIQGILREVTTTVQNDKLVTILKGYEICTYALKNTRSPITLESGRSLEEGIREILNHARIGDSRLSDLSVRVQGNFSPLPHRVFPQRTLMRHLDELAGQYQSEFLVLKNKVWFGNPIRDDEGNRPQVDLKPDVNLASFSPVTRDVESNTFVDPSINLLEPTRVTMVEGFRFIAIGDPKLRPGQKVTAEVDTNAVDQIANFNQIEFRIHSLVHNFSTSSGYTCEGSAIKACESGSNCRSREATLAQPNAEEVAERINRRSDADRRGNPTLQVGKVQAYTPGSDGGESKHLSTLYFGQRFEGSETQPSIHVVVDEFEQQIFRDKPIASPFAWHKCGLVTPVYPGMKALLSHHLDLQDDAIISGFLWSTQPTIEPPQNQAGDWWLCLPINPAHPPAADTKAANDLTAKNGKRVVEVRGLKITVGETNLRTIGTRPEEGDDDEFLIEHKSGTQIRIASDGTLTIEAQRISIQGDVTIQGNLDVR